MCSMVASDASEEDEEWCPDDGAPVVEACSGTKRGRAHAEARCSGRPEKLTRRDPSVPVSTLRQALRRRGLRVNGPKSELVERLRQAAGLQPWQPLCFALDATEGDGADGDNNDTSGREEMVVAMVDARLATAVSNALVNAAATRSCPSLIGVRLARMRGPQLRHMCEERGLATQSGQPFTSEQARTALMRWQEDHDAKQSLLEAEYLRRKRCRTNKATRVHFDLRGKGSPACDPGCSV